MQSPKQTAAMHISASLPAELSLAVEKAQKAWETARSTSRLWAKDPSLWTNSGEEQWLGWLDIVNQQLASAGKFQALPAEVREDGFTHFVLLGMGGSSLCPEVFGLTFAAAKCTPQLLVLDSTDPAQARAVRAKIDPARTLFCVSSKSGATLELHIFMRYFLDETRKAVGDRAGNHFITITDPGSKLEEIAAELGFRRVYHGVPDIGGRFSALSDFGMVPHAAIGLDSEEFLARANEAVEACKLPTDLNPGVQLGMVLGVAARRFRRDKVTLICSHSIRDLGAWIEQLIAASTGKEGLGLIPVDREPIADRRHYGDDRVFVYIRYHGDEDESVESHVAGLEKAGQPVVRMELDRLDDLGKAFFEWEFATAVAGALIGINPFNQPDVEASKVATRELTSAYEQTGAFSEEKPLFAQDGMKLFADPRNAEALSKDGAHTLGAYIRAHLDRLMPGDYFALLAYIPMFPEHEAILSEIRRHVLEAKDVATVLGFGPRFLHSTGQAYKAGPNTGVFLQITCDDAEDVAVPGEKYTFGIVKAAQARGDFSVLAARQRRALRIHLGKNVGKGLRKLSDLVCAALAH